ARSDAATGAARRAGKAGGAQRVRQQREVGLLRPRPATPRVSRWARIHAGGAGNEGREPVLPPQPHRPQLQLQVTAATFASARALAPSARAARMQARRSSPCSAAPPPRSTSNLAFARTIFAPAAAAAL